MNNNEIYMFGKNDRGQLGQGNEIGIDMVESCVYPAPVMEEGGIDTFKAKDFACGTNHMMLKGVDDNIYLLGGKQAYNPKLRNFEEDQNEDDPIDLNFSQMYCGKRHYCLVNKNNVLSWGNMFKKDKAEEIAGFSIHFKDSLFGGKNIKSMSMKYGLFGVITD